MTEILTAVGVVVAAIYAWLTYRILRTNQAIVRLMQDQQFASMRPYITVSAIPQAGTIVFLLRIANEGRSPAERLCLSIDRAFYQFGEKSEKKNIATFNAFTNEIPMVAPGAELIFHLGTSIQIFGGGTPGEMPQLFTISAIYHYGRVETYGETTTIDLRALYRSAVVTDSRVDELHEIANAIKALSR